MDQVTVIDHPLAAHHLVTLRDRRTSPSAFRAAVERLTYLLAYEATHDLATESVSVTTPLAEAEGRRVAERVGIVPVLRAGLGMVDPVLTVLPDAEVWHLGMHRDERTLEPVEYYRKLPASDPVALALVLDPMLATGGTAEMALRVMAEWGVPRIRLLSLIAAPEGIRRLYERQPEAEIFVCAVDSHLNDQGFIVPGLGDAGDRIFNARA